MKKRIAIITGGDSSELVISLKSAEQVRQNLDPAKFETFIVHIRGGDWHVRLDFWPVHREEPDDQWEDGGHVPLESGMVTRIPLTRDDFSFDWGGRTIRFDYAFIAMHGPPGEDGQLQAYLDKLGVPYSTSGARSLQLSFDKFASKELVEKAGILTAEAVLIRKEREGSRKSDRSGLPAGKATRILQIVAGDGAGRSGPEFILDKVGLPCFVKPNEGGSSFGVSRINSAGELENAITKALQEDDEVLVERFLPGRELTCGLLKIPGREFVFPVTEIISRNEFFDYEAKYTAGMAEEVTPAQIPDDLARQCRETSSRIYDLMDCRGLVRIDFIYSLNELYFLELNGVPGMSRESIIPKMIRTAGLTEAEIYNLIIEETLLA